MSRRRGTPALVSVLIMLGLGSLAPSGAVAQSGVDTLFPGAQLEPPTWVTSGTRVSFYTAGASIANASKQWEQDPNGVWEDPATGERYSQVDTPTASGEGIFQADVIGTAGTTVGLQWVLHGLDRWAGRFFGSLTGGATDPGAAAEEIWVHPELLARLPETDVGALKILRGPYVLEGTTYQAIAIANLDPAAYSSWIYDTESGRLLSGTTRTQGRASPVYAEGEDPLPANTQITLIRFLGTRQRDDTALFAEPPAWARPGTRLSWSGTWTFVNPFDPMGAPLIYPASMGMELGAGGPTWLAYGTQLLVDIGGVPNLTTATGVAGGNGPYWIDPGVLAYATEGQLIDEDPITGERVTIEAVGAGPNGEAVTIVSAMPGITSRATFDVETGVLLATSRSEDASGITIDLALDALP